MQRSDENVATTSRVSTSSHRAAERSTVPQSGRRTRLSTPGKLVTTLLRAFGQPRIRFVLWNGERIDPPNPPVATIRIADRRTLLKLCADPDLHFGEAYSDGRLEVEGDFIKLIEEIYRSPPSGKNPVAVARRVASRLHRRPSNTLDGSRDNIHRHYDIGNDFYSAWLGPTMAYTCAYYPTPTDTLEVAQFAKMDHVARKLRLRPGQSVVEAGCGWGSLALHMARHYGVKVRAFNISREQLEYARQMARQEGLDGAVEFVEDDYRNIAGQYDAFVSVGMLEHVGVENYPQLGEVIDRALKPKGLGLIHSIGRNRAKPMHRWIDRYIFPGANPPSLREMTGIFEGRSFSVLDVENIRLHYARTLEHWYSNYEESKDRVATMFDERFVRMWRLYLLGSIAAFRSGELQLFQVVFARGDNNEIPWTRADIYE